MKTPVIALFAMFLTMAENFNEVFVAPVPEVVPVEAKDEDDDDFQYDDDCSCEACVAMREKKAADDPEDNLCTRCGCGTNFDEGDYLDGDFTCYECMTANEYRDI